MNVTAHKALPLDRFLTFPYRTLLHLLKIAFKATAVMVLYLCYGTEMLGYFGETLLIGNLSRCLVKLHAFHHLLIGCRGKI